MQDIAKTGMLDETFQYMLDEQISRPQQLVIGHERAGFEQWAASQQSDLTVDEFLVMALFILAEDAANTFPRNVSETCPLLQSLAETRLPDNFEDWSESERWNLAYCYMNHYLQAMRWHFRDSTSNASDPGMLPES